MFADPVLIVDDEPSIREVLSAVLSDAGCRTLAAGTAEDGLDLMDGATVSVALVDLKLPGMSGIELLAEIKRRSPSTEVIIMTSYASLETAIEAIRKDAYDYLQKPFEDLEQPWVVVRRALEKRALTLRNRELMTDLERRNRELATAVKRQKSLIDAGRAMSGIVAISELLDFFIGVAVDELDVERASLMLMDEKTAEMWIAASRGLDKEVAREVRVKVGEGIAGWVAREGKPILVKDVETDPRIKRPLETTSGDSFISAPIVLSIPILIREKVLGVINVTNRRSCASFDEEDMEFLYSLAGQAAVAIERARHFEDLENAYLSLKEAQRHLVESERLNAVGQLAAGVAHDFNNLLTSMLGQAELLKVNLANSPPDIEASRKRAELLETLALQGAAAVRRMQDFTRIRKDTPSETVDLNAVMRNAVEVTQGKWKDECLAQGMQVNIRMEPGKIPLTAGNDSELTQVVGNLIFNAVEAMNGGGGDHPRDAIRREGHPALGDGQRPRDVPRGPATDLRALLHDEGARPGPGDEHHLLDRREARRGDHGPQRGEQRVHDRAEAAGGRAGHEGKGLGQGGGLRRSRQSARRRRQQPQPHPVRELPRAPGPRRARRRERPGGAFDF